MDVVISVAVMKRTLRVLLPVVSKVLVLVSTLSGKASSVWTREWSLSVVSDTFSLSGKTVMVRRSNVIDRLMHFGCDAFFPLIRRSLHDLIASETR